MGSVLEVLRRSKNIAIGPKDTRSYFIRFRPSSEIVVSSTQNFYYVQRKLTNMKNLSSRIDILETFWRSSEGYCHFLPITGKVKFVLGQI